LRLAAPQLAALKPAQILEFPSPPLLIDFDPSDTSDEQSGDGNCGASLVHCAALFAHTKATYLLERACQRHDITSLLVCIDPATAHDDDLSPAVAEWIETTQGYEPHQRERLQTGLFVVGTKLDQLNRSTDPTAQSDAETSVREAAQRWGDQLGTKLSCDIGADQEWPLEWTPGRAFHNIYLVRRPAGSVEREARAHVQPATMLPGTITAGAVVELAQSPLRGADLDTVLKAPQLARHIDNSGRTRSGVSETTDGGVGHLLAGLVSAVQASAKHRQLNTHLVDLRRRLRSRLLRLHLSNDPSQIAEWRRQLAIVAQGRLHRVVLADRMHVLQLGLGVAAHELSVLYFGALHANHSANFSPMVGPRAVGRSMDAATCERLAMATVEYWLQAIRQVGRSTRFCRSVNVSQPVLQHIIDEISIGAMRLGLATHLAETFQRAAQAPTQAPLSEAYFAMAAARVIGCYVEQLSLPVAADRRLSEGSNSQAHSGTSFATIPPSGMGHASPLNSGSNGTLSGGLPVVAARRDAGSFSGSFSGREAGVREPSANAPAGNGAMAGSVAANAVGKNTWADAYASLVDANIAAAAHLTGSADRDRELGELLVGFLASPLEVEP
jgi:hypothetical protein